MVERLHMVSNQSQGPKSLNSQIRICSNFFLILCELIFFGSDLERKIQQILNMFSPTSSGGSCRSQMQEHQGFPKSRKLTKAQQLERSSGVGQKKRSFPKNLKLKAAEEVSLGTFQSCGKSLECSSKTSSRVEPHVPKRSF